jgi:hypothetical protein
MQVWTVAMGQTVFTEFGSPFRPSQTTKNTSATPRFFRSVRTAIQNFADFPPPSRPNPQDVLLPVQVDPDRGVDPAGCRSVRHGP